MKLFNLSLPMDLTILKMFGTGQITLPKKWRSKFKSDHFRAVMDDKKITLYPIEEIDEDEDDGKWITFFDAKDFNDGKGVPIDVFYEALNKSLEKGK